MENNTYDLDVTAATADSRVPLPGAVLAAARVARGMSEEDIARRLKLSVAQVKAIETGDHSRLPSEVFVRGFIRSYARLLNVDIAPLLPRKEVAPPEIANERMMKQAPGVSMEPSRYRRLPVMAASAALVLSGLVY